MKIDQLTGAQRKHLMDLRSRIPAHIPAVCHTDNMHERFQYAREHIAWMLDEMLDKSMEERKFNRRLGFVQGVMTLLCYTTINEQREEMVNQNVSDERPE